MINQSHGDYFPTCDEFLAHWNLANTALGAAGPILVGDGQPRATLQAAREALTVKHEELALAENRQQIAAAAVEIAREPLFRSIGLLYDTVGIWWRDLVEGQLTRALPQPTCALDKLLAAARRAQRLWARVNSAPPPPGVTLPLLAGPAPGLGIAGMAALSAAAQNAREEAESVEFLLETLREERDALERRIQVLLGSYRAAAPLRLGPSHHLVSTIPRLWPKPKKRKERAPAPPAPDAAP